MRDFATYFNRWCTASQVETLEDLQDLILLEQFKNTLPDRVATYINEQKVSKLSEAAKLAEEFVLTHKGFLLTTAVVEILLSESNVGAHHSKHLTGGTDKFSGKADHGLQGKFDPNQICNFCFGKGHWRNECPVLKKKSRSGYVPAKPSGAVASRRAGERAKVIAAVRTHKNFS